MKYDNDHRYVASKYAQADFYYFSRWMFLQQRGYQWQRAQQHQQICDALMRIYNGECKRLIINIPPRYSKTQLAMIYFMAWTLGHCPDAEFIHTSYSGRLATNNSYQTRELIQHEAYREIFGDKVQLKTDSTAKDEWRTTEGGCVYAVGAGGTITGFGAGKVRDGFGGAILIDDPHKPDEATSDVMRQNVIDWFQNTLESRTNSPETPIILIMQRLHENDLSGFLLGDRGPTGSNGVPIPGGNGEIWDHLCLKALQDDGTALWPEKHSVTSLLRMQKSAPIVFAGQYQQSPTAPEGNVYKPDNIRIIDAMPTGMRMCRAWDLGATVKGDWTVGFLLGKHNGRYVIADIVRMRGGPDEVDAAVVNTARLDGTAVHIRWPQDPGQAGKAQVAHYSKLLAGYTFKALPVTGDKVTRSQPWASQINVGNVDMVRAPWNNALKSEMRVFPNGTWDDQCDAGADAFSELEPKGLFAGRT